MTITPVVGTVITTSCAFSESGVVADPGTVVCRIEAPDGTVTVETYDPGDIVRDGAGLYHLAVLVTAAGVWEVQWEGSGAGPNVVQCAHFAADEACIATP